jgi:hypothetical protein
MAGITASRTFFFVPTFLKIELSKRIPVAIGHKWKISGFRRFIDFFA